eukprot:567777-Prorocentrum_minimum.AAC.1
MSAAAAAVVQTCSQSEQGARTRSQSDREGAHPQPIRPRGRAPAANQNERARTRSQSEREGAHPQPIRPRGRAPAANQTARDAPPQPIKSARRPSDQGR